jgi:hypothetical protein
MRPLPGTPQMLAIARSVIWFEPPEQALADPVRFLAYAMTYALPENMRAIRKYVSDDEFREALDRAPPGIIDPRSWAYWNSKMGRYPAPPRPVRRFGNTSRSESLAHTQEEPRTSVPPSRSNDLEAIRREGRTAWLRMRQQNPVSVDLEQIRRQARENWLAEFGPKKGR